jgi:imidazolonepropionase-like amidohydrolase
MPPRDRVVAATGDAAAALNVDDKVGCLTAENPGDRLIVRGGPCADVGALRHVEAVWKDGRPLRFPPVGPIVNE